MTEPVTDQQIGRRIQTVRAIRNLSQGELAVRLQAEGLNWSQGTLSKVENGERPVRLTEAPAVAQILDLSVEDLVSAPVDALTVAWQRAQKGAQSSRQRVLNAEEAARQFAAAATFWACVAQAHTGDVVQCELTRAEAITALSVDLWNVSAILTQVGAPNADPQLDVHQFMDVLSKAVPSLQFAAT